VPGKNQLTNTDPARLRNLARCLCFLVTAAAASNAAAAALPAGYRETLVATGVSSATAMQFAPDGRLFVCEQGGNLRVIKNGVLLPTPFVSVTVNSNGERGLLGVAFDPNFASNQFVYLYYTATSPAIHNRISRFTANGDVAVPASGVVLLDLPALGATNHNGGALNFGPDGKLYAAVGENAVASNSQSLSTPLGKILRINNDGTIPTDNPFYGSTTGNNRAIWALGLRNPFTFAFDSSGSRMFINDVGETMWEEIDDGIAGANYGWPVVEGPLPLNQPYTYPRYWYDHSQNNGGCAITGGAFYNPPVSQFPPSDAGHYFFADLCRGWIRKLDPSTNQAVTFATGISLPVDLKVGTDGALYYLSRGSGSVVRVTSTTTADSVTPASGGGTVQTFALRYSDTVDAGDLATLVAWFAATPASSTVNSCFAYYETSSNLVFLLNDAARAWTSGIRGSNTVIQNSQCAIQLASTTVTGSGPMLTLNLAVTFNAAYAGAKTTLMLAGNFNGTSSGWQAKGMWTVPDAVAPAADGVMPASGSGPSQTFALQYSDPAGAANLAATLVWFTPSLQGGAANTCLAYYEPGTGRVYLLDDAGSMWSGEQRGSAVILQNSQCAIRLAATTVTAGGDTLTLNLPVTFKSTFVKIKWIAMYAVNYNGANSNWQIRGTWTGTPSVVTADAVTPSSGSGAIQTFALQYSDSAGFADLAATFVWFTAATGSAANTCVAYYEPATDGVYLANDAGSLWIWGQRGSAATLQNSQCAISLSAATVTAGGGNTLTVNLPVTFKPAFAGFKWIFMYASGISGPNSDWQIRGSWTAP
jgi:glucose/arabinose dehydrogenase